MGSFTVLPSLADLQPMEIHFAVNGTTDTLVVDIDDPPELARARKVHRFAERKLQVELD